MDEDAPKPSNRDLWIGVGLTFLIPIVAGLFVSATWMWWARTDWTVLYWLVGTGALPWLAVFLYAKRRGYHGIAKGMLRGIVILFSVAVLLSAACFGLMCMSGGFLK